MGEGGVKAAMVAEHLFAQAGPDEGAVRGVMSEGGVRTFLSLGPAGMALEFEDESDDERLARALLALLDRLLWIAYAPPPMTERQIERARQKASGELDRWFRWPG